MRGSLSGGTIACALAACLVAGGAVPAPLRAARPTTAPVLAQGWLTYRIPSDRMPIQREAAAVAVMESGRPEVGAGPLTVDAPEPLPELPASPEVGAAGATHVVLPGETLTSIAAFYGTSVSALAELNGMSDPGYLVVGQQLAVPGSGALPQTQPPAWVPYQVIAGDSLFGIALAHGTTVAELAAVNGMADPSLLITGTVIQVPAAGGASGGAPSPAIDVAPPPDELPAGSGTMPDSMAGAVAARDATRQVIVAEASAFGVPPAFALAVAWQESGWQQGVVSSAGAYGVMQLLPTTAEWIAVSLLSEPVDVLEERANVRAGVRLLRHYLDRYGGDRALALAAYYQGQHAADHYGVYPSSWPYVGSILALEAIFGS